MKTEKAVAIITARGGSKRIPKKNIKEFCGKPVLAYSIEAALESGIFQEIMVSTDDEDIAMTAKKYGAKVPFMRSGENANDYATTAEVIAEVLNCYKKNGKEFSYACCIYPTAPFITPEKLKMAMKILEEEMADSVMPVTAFAFPPMRGMYLDDGMLHYSFPEFANSRSQDIRAMYHDCGQFYFMNTAAFRVSKKLVSNNTRAIIMPEMEVQDIDNEQDWKIAEIKYQFMKAGQ